MVTFTGSGGTEKCYIDTVYVGATAHQAQDSIDYLGNYQGGGQTWGTMEDVRVYNRVLSSSDLTQLYAYSPNTYADAMASTNYAIQTDSINFAGNKSSSSYYSMQDTVGEIATGFSSSTNYSISAGYQQMNIVALSVVPPTSVTMTSALGGITGGISNGSTTFIVTTDDTAGYTSYIQASSSPALVDTSSTTNSFADYTPSGSVPDFTFSLLPAQSLFAFSVQGTDADQRWKNNGSVCDSGSLSSTETCWDGLSTSSKTVADRTSDNQPSGTQSVLYFRAGIGSDRNQPNGLYVATTTLTVIPL